MKNFKLLGFIFVLFSGYANSAVVNLGSQEVFSDALSSQTITLSAGTYLAQLIERDVPPSTWNAWGDGVSAGCTAGTNCAKGWLNSYNIAFDGDETSAIQVGSNGVRYETESLAFASAGTYQFTLTSEQDLTFYISDSIYSDNVGGLTVSVSPVPEASTIAMMTLGLGVAGFFARRKK